MNDWTLNVCLIAIVGLLVQLRFLIEERFYQMAYRLEDIESILKYIMNN